MTDLSKKLLLHCANCGAEFDDRTLLIEHFHSAHCSPSTTMFIQFYTKEEAAEAERLWRLQGLEDRKLKNRLKKALKRFFSETRKRLRFLVKGDERGYDYED